MELAGFKMSSVEHYSPGDEGDTCNLRIFCLQELTIYIRILNDFRRATGPNNAGPIFSGDKVDNIADIMREIFKECAKDSSSKSRDMSAGGFISETIGTASDLAKSKNFQQVVADEIENNPDIAKQVEKLANDVDSFNSFDNQNGSGDQTHFSELPFVGKLLTGLQMVLKKIGKLGSAAVERVLKLIMQCFKVAKKVAHKILATIQRSFAAMWKALVHPEGALRRILIDPVMSRHQKVQRVLGVFARNIVNALIVACMLAPDPTGISTVVASALQAACPRLGWNA